MANQVLERSELADVVSDRVYEFVFAGFDNASGSSGAVLSLKSSMAGAENAVFLGIGGSGAATAAVLTAAKAATLINRDGVAYTQIPIGRDIAADQVNIRTGLVNYFDEIEATAHAADSVGFAVAGLNFQRPVSVELVVTTAASGATYILRNDATPVAIPEPVSLGAASELIKTGTTEIDFDTDTLCYLQRAGVVFGSIKQAGTVLTTLAAADTVKLVVRVRA